MTFYLALGAALLGAASLVLHALAPKSKTIAVLADDVDKLKAMLPK